MQAYGQVCCFWPVLSFRCISAHLIVTLRSSTCSNRVIDVLRKYASGGRELRMKDGKRGLEVIKGLSRWIEGLKGRETWTKTHHGNQEHEKNWKRMKCNMHKRECEKLVTPGNRYLFYLLHICSFYAYFASSMFGVIWRCGQLLLCRSYVWVVGGELDQKRTVRFWYILFGCFGNIIQLLD